MANKYIIPNLQKACRALDLLGQRPDGLTVSDASRALNIPQTTALRIFSTLEAEGFVEKVGRLYSLGASITRLQLQKSQQFDLVRTAKPAMQQLAIDAGETAHLAVPSGFKTLIVGVCESPHPIRASSHPGTLADSHCCATGKNFISHLFQDRLEEYVESAPLTSRTKHTITEIDSLREEISHVLKKGYAMDDEEYCEDVRCIAAPIFDQQSNVIASVGITASTQRFTRRRIPEMAKHVQAAAASITEQVTI